MINEKTYVKLLSLKQKRTVELQIALANQKIAQDEYLIALQLYFRAVNEVTFIREQLVGINQDIQEYRDFHLVDKMIKPLRGTCKDE